MQPLTLVSSARGCEVSGWLNVMDQLSSRFLVRSGDQFTEGPIDGNEQLVSVVEIETSQKRAIGPLSDTLVELTDDPIEAFRTTSANLIPNGHLQGSRIELMVL